VDISHWQECLDQLQEELSDKQFNTWIRPLQAEIEGNELTLLAPNNFVLEYIEKNFYQKIIETLKEQGCNKPSVRIVIGSLQHEPIV